MGNLSADEKKRRWEHLMDTDPVFRARAAEKMSPDDWKTFTPKERSPENIAAGKQLDALLKKHFGVTLPPPQQ